MEGAAEEPRGSSLRQRNSHFALSVFVNLTNAGGNTARRLGQEGDALCWKELGCRKILWDRSTTPASGGLPLPVTTEGRTSDFLSYYFFSLSHVLPTLILEVLWSI